MPPAVPLLAALAYVALLFVFAASVEARRHEQGRVRSMRRWAYALALAVYCTSWTFYGAVGTAAGQGWSYLAIYLGPVLLYLLGGGFLRQIVREVQADGATSISDFIGGRFGKSQGVAALVTLLALLGSIPYLALQLRSVGTSFSLMAGKGSGEPVIMALTATALGLFAILFGTRRYEVAARNDGLLYAIALESIVKLIALMIAAVFAWAMLSPHVPSIWVAGANELSQRFSANPDPARFIVSTLLSIAAILCLPRQFYVGVIEADSPDDPLRARVPFIGYLLATVIAVVPIAFAGLLLLPAGQTPDLFVVQLPLFAGKELLALLVFVGGFSAATAMVLVETIALSTMISNDFIAPLMLRRGALAEERNLGRWMLRTRRITIVVIMAAALVWSLSLGERASLAAIGLVAFVAMAQFAPALVMATRRRDNDAVALKAGLTAGLLLWSWTLALPQVLPQAWMVTLSGSLIDPLALAGLGGVDPIVHGTLWSLGANFLAFGMVAARRLEAASSLPFVSSPGAMATDMGALAALTERFVGRHATEAVLGSPPEHAPIDRRSALAAERLIAGVIGVPSARALMKSALLGARLGPEDVARLLDESGQSLQFSKGLLAATLENIDPGVSVVDRNLNLVAWNSRYLDLFGYPRDMVRVGAPVADLIRYNATRGECGPGEIEQHVEKRLEHMRRSTLHSFERVRPDGRVLKTVGGPMPGGGYVMCFTDVTEEAAAKVALERARRELETRVRDRTGELLAANDALAAADRDKTRFLAAASHDLLQPLHAARLFSAALGRDVNDKQKLLLTRIDRSIQSADELLRALLDISKLDAGGVTPHFQEVPLGPLITRLAEEMRPMAEARGLKLLHLPTSAGVWTDPVLLRSILQNFLSNAVRYTERGRILIGVRPHGETVRIDVLDTGVGIPAAKIEVIFREFERLGNAADGGVGLGLAIVERTARLLHVPLVVRSREGRGSRFSVTVPRVGGEIAEPVLEHSIDTGAMIHESRSLSVLIVDDRPANGEAMASYVRAAGHRASVAQTVLDALTAEGPFDVALVDYDLGEGDDGLTLIAELRRKWVDIRCALVTAERSAMILERAQRMGVAFLAKPLAPQTLDDWLAGRPDTASDARVR